MSRAKAKDWKFIGEIKEPETIDEILDSMHDVSEGTEQAIMNEYDRRPEQPTEPHNPLQKELQSDYEEEKAETERINNLPQDKLRRFLEQPDEE